MDINPHRAVQHPSRGARTLLDAQRLHHVRWPHRFLFDQNFTKMARIALFLFFCRLKNDFLRNSCAFHQDFADRRPSLFGSLRGGNLLQSCKRVDQRAIVALAFAAIALDVLQHPPHSVNRIQQRGGDLGGQCQRAIAQPAEQVFSDVRQFFELVETQKAASALNGVDDAEDAGQRTFIGRIFLEFDQFAVQPVKVLVTFDQKVFNDVAFTHHNSGAGNCNRMGPIPWRQIYGIKVSRITSAAGRVQLGKAMKTAIYGSTMAV